MRLLPRAICPHCWVSFAPEDVLWVSAHAELVGDVRLGPDQPMRFLPSRFDLKGRALDVRGFACHQLACPNCHLGMPRALLELPTYFISILGTPGCGKSVFLAAMTWMLRKSLPAQCGLMFQDIDPDVNRILTDYEHQMFFSQDAKTLVPMHDLIRKTEKAGDQYDFISDGDQVIQLPRPFLFVLKREDRQPNKLPNLLDRALCLYDNAGEHFQAGQDSVSAPVTQHLLQSDLLMFLFDPLQHPRFAAHVSGGSDVRPFYNRQELVLLEAGARVRRLQGLSQHDVLERPLLVIVTKSDVWHKMVDALPGDLWESCRGNLQTFFRTVDEISQRLRQVLMMHCPEVVGAAEALARPVVYFPVSALGTTPVRAPRTGKPSIAPNRIDPRWVTVPLVYALYRYAWNAPNSLPTARP
jgi:hypothetical protein